MGKSNAQCQGECRERQKNLNLEEYRKNELDRVNANKKRQNQTTFKAKHREATARWQESKRKKEKESNPSLVQSPMIVDLSLMSKQSLGKAMRKVKNALLQSPRRKKVVVRALAASLDLIQQKRKTSHGLEQCHIDTVQAFYCQEDIARFMPGKQSPYGM